MTFIRKLPSRNHRQTTVVIPRRASEASESRNPVDTEPSQFRTASGILDHPLSRVMTTENAPQLPRLPQRRADRLPPLRVVEPGIVVGQRLRRLDVQGREHRAVLLEHMSGLLLEIGELREVVDL